ncbi:hypothetical protein AM465_00330 [Escherichia coli]|nr:hypothetical protein AM465_00330 [Escherichia coli]
MKAGAERSWLSGGRGKKNKKIPQSCGAAGALRRSTIDNYSYVTTKKLTQRNYTRHSQFVKM